MSSSLYDYNITLEITVTVSDKTHSTGHGKMVHLGCTGAFKMWIFPFLFCGNWLKSKKINEEPGEMSFIWMPCTCVCVCLTSYSLLLSLGCLHDD